MLIIPDLEVGNFYVFNLIGRERIEIIKLGVILDILFFTHHQNGRSKRKHGHIVEVRLSSKHATLVLVGCICSKHFYPIREHLGTPFCRCPLPDGAMELKADSFFAYDLVLTTQGLF